MTPNDVLGTRRLTLALPSFLSEVLFPKLAAIAGCPLRAVGLPQAALGRSARAHAIDLAVTIGKLPDLPETWSLEHVGELRHGLFAGAGIAGRLGDRPSVDDIRKQPFVVATYVAGLADGVTELVSGDDRCPLARGERLVGHEVETMRLASRVAAETDHLVYGPTIAVHPLLDAGALVEVSVPGWIQSDPLYLTSDPARVSATQEEEFAKAIRTILEGIPRASGIVPVVGSSRPPRATNAAR
jgi:hypothetical protein